VKREYTLSDYEGGGGGALVEQVWSKAVHYRYHGWPPFDSGVSSDLVICPSLSSFKNCLYLSSI